MLCASRGSVCLSVPPRSRSPTCEAATSRTCPSTLASSSYRHGGRRPRVEVPSGSEEHDGRAILHAMETPHVLAGRFEVEGLAGTGGVGSIYRGLDRQTGKVVAIKVLRLEG